MIEKPNVFISWSGEQAKEIASVLRAWLKKYYDALDVFFSDESIEAGQRGLAKIHANLRSSNLALVVATQHSMESAWVNYEIGIMSGILDTEGAERKVIPVLVDLDSPSQMTGPIKDFQAVALTKSGMTRMLESLNRAIGIDVEKAQDKIDAGWDELSARLEEAKQFTGIAEEPVKKREPYDLLVEILETVRQQARSAPVAPNDSLSQSERNRLRRDTSLYEAVIDTLTSVGLRDQYQSLAISGNQVHVAMTGSMNENQVDELARHLQEVLGRHFEIRLTVSDGGDRGAAAIAMPAAEDGEAPLLP